MPAPSITLKTGQTVNLVYNKLAIFRADEVGAWDAKPGSVGFSRATKFVWAMLPQDLQRSYPTPESLAEHMPPTNSAWDQIHAAIGAAGEEMEAKNVLGSPNGPTPSSSSTSPAKKDTGISPQPSSTPSTKRTRRN